MPNIYIGLLLEFSSVSSTVSWAGHFVEPLNIPTYHPQVMISIGKYYRHVPVLCKRFPDNVHIKIIIGVPSF